MSRRLWLPSDAETDRPPLLDREVTVRGVPDDLGLLHEALQRFWVEFVEATSTELPPRWRLLFEIAVLEIANNIVRHAQLDRARSATFAMRLSGYADRVVASFYDSGLPFISDKPRSRSIEHLDVADLPERGYGLQAARDAVDSLHYSRSVTGHNNWRLVKYLPR